MGAAVPFVVEFVAGKVEGRGHELVLLPPVAKDVVPGIVHAILKEDAQRLWLGFPNQGRVFVAAAHCNKGSYGAVYAGEHIRSFPSYGKGCYAAAAGSGNGAVVRVF